jgi:hypothetical protein
MSPITAAGIPPIKTVGAPGPVMGPPTCGMGGNPGVTIGQTCISVNLAAGFPINEINYLAIAWISLKSIK